MTGCRKPAADTHVDVSRAAQIRDIEASFAAANGPELSALRHPNKPNVTAVEYYDVLPDASIWANAYDLFRFSERPGDKPRPPDVGHVSVVKLTSPYATYRRTIPDWTVLYSVLWSPTATISLHITSPKKMRPLSSSSTHDFNYLSTGSRKMKCVLLTPYHVHHS